jgi:LPS-assembly protein
MKFVKDNYKFINAPAFKMPIKFLKIFIFSIFFFVYFCLYSFAETPEKLKNTPPIPWHITADKVKCNQDQKICTAQGNVIISRENETLFADFIRYDPDKMLLFAQGNVLLLTKDDELKGNKLEINLNDSTGRIYEASLLNKPTEFRIKGGVIIKTGKNSYTSPKCSFSSCKGDLPDWKITADDFKINMDKYGSAKNVKLWAKKIPVFYMPFIIFPANQDRQTGFLIPEFGYSDNHGEEFGIPFFWAINDSEDATFYLNHMGKRGENFGIEYRYVLDEYSKGTIIYDFLDDRKQDNGFKSDSYMRTNSDRYWLRAKFDQKLPLDFNAKLDIDFASDQDYLAEFKNELIGFNATNKYYEKYFKRSLDDYNENTRINKLNLSKIWSQYTFNIDAKWHDNIIDRRYKDTDTALYMPCVKFGAAKQKLGKTFFYYDFNLDSAYSYINEGNKILFADIYPRFYIPFSFNNYLNVEPSLGLRETFWKIDKYDDQNENLTRGLYDIRLDVSSNIYNIFNTDFNKIDKIKHSIVPNVIYEYIPDEDKNEYPDPVYEKNLITYSLTNYFTSRSVNKEENKTAYSYNQFARLKFWQSLDFIKKNDETADPFSDIHAELEFYPVKYISIKSDIGWSPYRSDFTTSNLGIKLSNNRGDNFFTEYRYNKDNSESVYTSLLFNLNELLSFNFKHERNLYTDENIIYEAGFLYKRQCWSFDLGYINEQSDKKIEFMLNLYGLGEIGSD